MTPSSDSDQLIKFRKQLYLWLWFIIEGTNEQPDEEVPRRGTQERLTPWS